MSEKTPLAMLIYENTVPAAFVRRINRFVAEVLVDGRTERVHVKNTGRLKELLLPDARVMLQKAADPNRKTAYDLISVWRPGLEWVNIDSLAPNELMKRLLLQQDYDVVKPEFTYGESRFDFYMMKRVHPAGADCAEGLQEVNSGHNGSGKLPAPGIAPTGTNPTAAAGLFRTTPAWGMDEERFLTEVKGCTLAPDLEQRIGLFPDAPTQRGVKHLDELAAAAREGYHCQIAFVIQMNGIPVVLPNDSTHPEFGQALVRAVKAGVRVVCYGCSVEADRICITGVVDDTERYTGEQDGSLAE